MNFCILELGGDLFMGKFDTKLQRQGSHIQLSLGGTIDEDADFSPLDIRGGEKYQSI